MKVVVRKNLGLAKIWELLVQYANSWTYRKTNLRKGMIKLEKSLLALIKSLPRTELVDGEDEAKSEAYRLSAKSSGFLAQIEVHHEFEQLLNAQWKQPLVKELKRQLLVLDCLFDRIQLALVQELEQGIFTKEIRATLTQKQFQPLS